MISIATLCIALAMAYAIWIAAGGIAPDVPDFPPRATVFPFVMMHWDTDGCGSRAFLMAVKPECGRAASSWEVAHLDGRPMERYSKPRRDSCGKIMRLISANVVTDVPDRDMGAA